MHTNSTCFYRSAPDVTFDYLRIDLLLHNKKKCDLVIVVPPATFSTFFGGGEKGMRVMDEKLTFTK